MVNKEINPEYLVCPIRNVIDKFGDKWSLLVLYELNIRSAEGRLQGKNGTMRFNELHRAMTDCSQKMLSQTLKRLEQIHLVHRKVYAEVPPRVEYSLTETGQSLMPVVSQLIDWAKEHFDDVVKDIR